MCVLLIFEESIVGSSTHTHACTQTHHTLLTTVLRHVVIRTTLKVHPFRSHPHPLYDKYLGHDGLEDAKITKSDVNITLFSLFFPFTLSNRRRFRQCSHHATFKPFYSDSQDHLLGSYSRHQSAIDSPAGLKSGLFVGLFSVVNLRACI